MTNRLILYLSQEHEEAYVDEILGWEGYFEERLFPGPNCVQMGVSIKEKWIWRSAGEGYCNAGSRRSDGEWRGGGCGGWYWRM